MIPGAADVREESQRQARNLDFKPNTDHIDLPSVVYLPQARIPILPRPRCAVGLRERGITPSFNARWHHSLFRGSGHIHS